MTKIDHDNRAHAIYSMSAAAKWLYCTASHEMEKQFPQDDTPTKDQALGTKAHEACQFWLTTADKTDEHLLRVCDGDTEMFEHVKGYERVISETFPSWTLHVEKKIKINNKCWGTADLIAVSPDRKHLGIMDFKYGAGVAVNALDNPQLAGYAIAAANGKPVNSVTCAIYQPRTRTGDVFSKVVYSMEDIARWCEMFINAIEQMETGKTSFMPSEKSCRWCRASGACPARATYILNSLDNTQALSVRPPALPLPITLTNEQISTILDREDEIRDFLKSVRAEALERIRHDAAQIPGYGLSTTRTNRVIPKDRQDDVANWVISLGKDPYTKELKTVKQLEEVVGKEHKAELNEKFVVKPQGAITLSKTKTQNVSILED